MLLNDDFNNRVLGVNRPTCDGIYISFCAKSFMIKLINYHKLYIELAHGGHAKIIQAKSVRIRTLMFHLEVKLTLLQMI